MVYLRLLPDTGLLACHGICSVSSLLTTTEAVVVELPKEEKATPAMGGGMGDMDY